MPLILSGSVDISGSMTATTIVVSAPGAAGMVSSSAQITELVPLMAYTASLKSVAIVSSSQQIQNYNTFAQTSSANTFYGNQGISGSLNVTSATGTSVTPQLTVNNTTTNGYGILRLVGAARGGIIDFYNTSSAQASIAANDGELQFYTNGNSTGTPKVTINSSGNLESVGTFSFKSLFSAYNTDGLFNANSRPSAIVSPGGSQNIKFGYNDYGGGQYYGRIGFPATTNWSLGIIDSAGNNFSIGTDYRGVQLYIYSNGNYAFSGSNVSDSRKKANINYIISNQLHTILKLKPACFNQKNQEGNINSNTHTGFIAQDVLEAGIANIVHGSDEEGYGLDYYGVLALSVKAIQEQQAIIDSLIARIETLENN
jgi:hypothetical protein